MTTISELLEQVVCERSYDPADDHERMQNAELIEQIVITHRH